MGKEKEQPKITKKEWGYEKEITNAPRYCTKEMGLNKGKRCSLHWHEIKDETFYIHSGRVLMQIVNKIGSEIRVMLPREFVRIKPGVLHRFSGLEDSVIIESSTHHEDSDSYRIKQELSGDVPKQIMLKYKFAN